jgi:hypothetical protein
MRAYIEDTDEARTPKSSVYIPILREEWWTQDASGENNLQKSYITGLLLNQKPAYLVSRRIKIRIHCGRKHLPSLEVPTLAQFLPFLVLVACTK